MNKGSDAILITGATGQQGGATARELLSRGHKVVAMTRSPDGDAAKNLQAQGAQVVQGNLDDAASLERSMSGMWGVFSVQNTWEAGVEQEEVQGKRLAEVAKKVGVQHFVYTSVGSAHRKTGIPHFDNKWQVEETIRGLDLPSYTIIRPVFFMENFVSPWFKPGIDDGKLTLAVDPKTTLQMIAVNDIGKYGALAFEDHERLKGKAIDIAGDELTMPQTAEALSYVIGRTIAFDPPPIEAVREFSEDFALMCEWFDRVGYEADIVGLKAEFGIAATKFADWAAQVSWDVVEV
jgi:uncharacterized protein YbjT (DUF2867 family)